ncbi:MAG: EpsG family protein [Zhenhengia sp.]|uniref:EpsG family protein n=1 Tax=Zhenhengia sp. TaxID=2944208 RepID=UPI0039922BDF
MSIYLINIVLILIIGRVVGNNKESRKILCMTFFLQLTLLSIFRDETVGADILTYKYHFENISRIPFPAIEYLDWEKGYVLLNSIIAIIYNDFRFFMIIVALIIIGGYTYFIYKNSYDITFSFFLLITFSFFTHSLNIYRQSIAIILILFAFEFMKKNKFLYYLLCVLLASTFHITAIIFLPTYFIKDIKVNTLNNIIILISLPIIYLLGSEVLEIMIYRYFPSYSGLVIKGEGGNLLIVFLCIYIFTLIYKKRLDLYRFKNKLNEDHEIFYIMALFSLVLQIFSLSFSLFARCVLYFSIFSIILIPNIVSSIGNKKEKFIIKTLIILVFIVFYIVTCLKDSASIIPYKLFF